MSNSYFQFKQFTVHHDKCAMKVGTDGVLLGAWCTPPLQGNILDIGTGSGMIALMLGQRSTAQIDAIDLDEAACLQAQENVDRSPYADRITVTHQSLQKYVQQMEYKYDLIVSNPPYFIHSLKSPDDQRTTARHTDSLSLDELISNSSLLMTEQGRIALILPFEQREELLTIAARHDLSVVREAHVIPIPDAPPKRLLVELTQGKHEASTPQSLVIEITRHQYTPEYIRLTRDFYLKM